MKLEDTIYVDEDGEVKKDWILTLQFREETLKRFREINAPDCIIKRMEESVKKAKKEAGKQSAKGRLN